MPPEASDPDYIRLDRLAEDIGEDPGRFLDGPIPAKPRIRGIDSLRVVRAWKGAERRIASIRNRDADQEIMQALDDREEYLEQRGEHTHVEDSNRPEKPEWRLNGEPWSEVDRSGATVDFDTDDSGGAAVATDGGEPDDE